jgi:pyruvate dehydrogenase E2 component (dihydrolipoamide acetyltransferase)
VALEITMPRLSDSMEEGTVARWLVEAGASVERGQAIAEIDTDKATVELEAEAAGTLLEIVVGEGESAPVGAGLAWLGAPGEAPPQRDAPAAAPGSERAPDVAPAAAPERAPTSRRGRANASPVAKRLARELGVDLEALVGSGPGGMITREDVQAAAAAGPAALGAGTASPGAKGETRVVELGRLQRTVARRMAEGSAAPDFAVETEIEMTRCVALRAELDGAGEGEDAPTLNDFVVRAAALALRDFPRLNGSYTERGFELYSRVNVGIAVATDDGLVVPTIFDADRKALAELAREARELARRVRDRTISPAELDGGTFTVSNLGMLGVRRFFPILNPPQAAILGVGEVARRAVVDEEGRLAVAELMSACLVCDHRIVYGAEAARFLGRLRELLERSEELVQAGRASRADQPAIP